MKKKNILRYITLTLAIMLASAIGIGAQEYDVNDIIARADSAYSADDFELAKDLYENAMSQAGTSSVMFYNLGNAYYRMGYLGKAVLNYERALKLNPTNSDARTNLEFVKGKLADKAVDNNSFLGSVWQGIVSAMTPNAWAWIAFVLFVVCLGGVLTYFLANVVTLRKVGFFGAGVTLLLSLMAMIVAFSAADAANDHSEAIILLPAAQLSTSPREARSQSEEAFLLHEGTKVQILDSVQAADDKWYEVSPTAGERAWIKGNALERI